MHRTTVLASGSSQEDGALISAAGAGGKINSSGAEAIGAHGDTAAAEQRQISQRRIRLAVAALFILVATIVAYSPALFNFFAGDDFVHLTWLKLAMANPELIWRNFHSSWLDGTTTKFYRPLISVFMVTDYLLWRINGLGFHITNLLFHLTSSILLFFIVRRLAEGGPAANKAKAASSKTKTYSTVAASRITENTSQPEVATIWALSASAIFALYPLHPEAVSWITGRVDCIVATFCLLSLWCYMRWRDGAGWLAYIGSMTSFVLALASKEMAITMPALLIVYEFFAYGKPHRLVPIQPLPAQVSPSSASAATFAAPAPAPAPEYNTAAGWLFTGLKRSMLTAPFWAVLAGYFLVRHFALGTFVGGYDDSLFFIANPQLFIASWLGGLRMLMEPLNKEFIGAHHPLTKIWEFFLILTAGLGLYRLRRQADLGGLFFSLIWLVLALAPVYKIFAITPDLQGSRLAYLATVPLSILFGYCFSSPILLLRGQTKPLAFLHWAIPGAFATLCACILFINNQAWRQAGQEANAIRAGLDGIYRNLGGDPQILFTGLPDQIHGAYVCRNALFGMTKSPQSLRDANNNVMAQEFEPVLPFGYLKDSIVENRQLIHIFSWRSATKQFVPIAIPTEKLSAWHILPAIALRRLPGYGTGSATTVQYEKDGSLTLAATGARGRPEIFFQLPGGLTGWTSEFISITADVKAPGQSGTGADLLYATQADPQFKLGRRVHADMDAKTGRQELFFSLRSLPDWALSGEHPCLKLMLPSNSTVTIKAITILPPAQLMPHLTFANSGYLGTKGYLHINRSQPAKALFIDASLMPQATGTVLEVAKPNMFFDRHNSKTLSLMKDRLLPAPLKGIFIIRSKDFPVQGLYELRAWCVDKQGKRIGVASDHITILVD